MSLVRRAAAQIMGPPARRAMGTFPFDAAGKGRRGYRLQLADLMDPPRTIRHDRRKPLFIRHDTADVSSTCASSGVARDGSRGIGATRLTARASSGRCARLTKPPRRTSRRCFQSTAAPSDAYQPSGARVTGPSHPPD